MKNIIYIILTTLLVTNLKSELYFPPINSETWETIPSSELSWSQNRIDSLYDLLDKNGTRAFVLLKDGKIVLEKYFNGHSASSNWYWASAGKSLTAFLIGLAQEDKLINIDDKTSKYLGEGWTSCTKAQEDKILIRHQLSMTTGLDETIGESFCTDDSCLIYKADAGTRWAYHTAPYTLLDKVIENSTGETMNAYMSKKLKKTIGMDGLYIKQDYNNIYFSTARSMARFGLLMLNRGIWNKEAILGDTAYFKQMINTSQSMNESYGFLWWLNGKNSYMIPQSQVVIKNTLCPNAPSDMFCAMGKNGQFINIVPSQNLVWIRMGEAPDNTLVPFRFNDKIWEYINKLNDNNSGIDGAKNCGIELINLSSLNNSISIKNISRTRIRYTLLDQIGRALVSGASDEDLIDIDLNSIEKGVYFLQINDSKVFKVLNE
jgi:CubicO group peptidase (beta-lactamase class C family)